MQEILKEFTKSIAPIPLIILPIPTYHYYVDGAKPIYKEFFNYFNKPEKKIFVLDLLENLKKIDFNKRQYLCFNEDKGHFLVDKVQFQSPLGTTLPTGLLDWPILLKVGLWNKILPF